MRSSGDRPIRRKASWILESGTRLRYGDCSSCTARACLSVPSKTGSPVVLTKSARRTPSFSVSREERLERRYTPRPMRTTSTPAATGRRIFHLLFDWVSAVVEIPKWDAGVGADAVPNEVGVWARIRDSEGALIACV